MMGHRGPMKGGGERTALTPFGKKYHKHRPGGRKYWKNKYIRRSRLQPYETDMGWDPEGIDLLDWFAQWGFEHHLEGSKHNENVDFVTGNSIPKLYPTYS